MVYDMCAHVPNISKRVSNASCTSPSKSRILQPPGRRSLRHALISDLLPETVSSHSSFSCIALKGAECNASVWLSFILPRPPFDNNLESVKCYGSPEKRLINGYIVIRICRCRLFEEGEAHALCVCGSPVIQVEREQQVRCHLAVEGVCASQLSGLGGNKTDSNSRLNNKIKVRRNSFRMRVMREKLMEIASKTL